MSKRWATNRDSYTVIFSRLGSLHPLEYAKLEAALNSIHTAFTNIDATALMTALTQKYYDRDINIPSKGINKIYDDADVNIFITDISNLLKLKAPYYNELISNYNKAYDYATGNKRRTHREDSWSKEGETSNTNATTGEHTEYELPNKVVAQNYKSTPSTIDTDTGNASNTGTSSSTTEGTSDTEVIYDNEFLDLKRKYLNQIRNVYEEYADEVNECFYMLYYNGLVKEEN